MRKSGWATASAIPAALALVLAGCGGGANTEAAGATDPNAAVSVYGTEPENTLLPANTNELGGTKAVQPMFAGLVGYRPDTGAPFNLMAESITTADAKTYDIRLKPGWTFHDGTEVTAKSFVDAWNWAAYAPNGQLNSDFFSQIAGFDAVHPGEGKQPTASTMSGLQVVGDHEFRVTLSAPFSVFPTKIGYTAFSPLPDSFFRDPKAFAEHPIGNGPLRFVSRTPNTDIKLTRFDGYAGPDKVKFKDLDIRIYQSQETAYQDLLSNRLDFMEALPPSAKAGGAYQRELGKKLVQGNLLGVSTIAVPYYRPEYNNLELRKAISMAINRDQIVRTVMNDTYVPLRGWVSHAIEGARPDTCGEACVFDPARAKQHLAASGFHCTLTITSNADGGRKEPLVAACNSISNALGVPCEFVPATSFGQFRQTINAQQLTGMARSDWSADYPSIEDFLSPIYGTDGSANDSGYSSPVTDGLLKQAAGTADRAAAIRLYQQAEDQIAKDLPQIPVWDEKGVGGKSDRLTSAGLDFRRLADYSAIEVAR